MSEKAILVVDDEENVRSALRRALRDEGYTVIVAESGDEGLKVLKEKHVDLVISDHLMPKMTGLEFLKLVHDRHPHVCRIILTGYADMETVVKAINEGEIYRFLQKPWDDVDLKVTLFLAFERLELEEENRRLLATVRRQSDFIKRLEKDFPGIGEVKRDTDGSIVLSDEELNALYS